MGSLKWKIFEVLMAVMLVVTFCVVLPFMGIAYKTTQHHNPEDHIQHKAKN
jgi:hypothetical protein